MVFHRHVPRAPLSSFIECFISYSGYEAKHAIDRFLPDGNTEIIIDLTDTPKPIYDNVTLTEIQSCRYCWASGIRTEPISIPSGNDSAMFIIAFRKGMAAPFFPVPMDEVRDSVVQADLLWREFFTDLRYALLEQRSARGRFAAA